MTRLRLGNDPIGKFLEDPVVAVGVGFRQVALSGRLPEPQVIGLHPMRLSGQYDIPKALSVRQLAEHQHSKLVPAGEVIDVMNTPYLSDILRNTSLSMKFKNCENTYFPYTCAILR